MLAHTPLSDQAFLQLWPAEHIQMVNVPEAERPTLEVFLPPPGQATGASFIVCPGGGYVMLADHEGAPVASWLARHGITAFVLRYRHAHTYHHPIPFEDAQRATRFVRAHAPAWQIDTERIGMLGFSAGGHLTSMLATHPSLGDATAVDDVEQSGSHLNAHVLIYPVISQGLGWDVWSNILGQNAAPELIELFCSEKHVTSSTPPAFLVHSIADQGVPVQHSDRYVAALQMANVPFTYLRADLGDHGFGLQESWSRQCLAWLQTLGWASLHTQSLPLHAE